MNYESVDLRKYDNRIEISLASTGWQFSIDGIWHNGRFSTPREARLAGREACYAELLVSSGLIKADDRTSDEKLADFLAEYD